MAEDFTPYSTAKAWFPSMPQWISEEDSQRLASYAAYEQMYWGHPGAFELTQKGTDADPIYIPAPKAIIEATHRYLAVGWDIVVTGADGEGQSEEAGAALKDAFTKLFERESMKAKFSTQKRFCLIRGDAMWHITADEMKDQGSRISIHELDPGSYFPIYDVDDLDKIVGCHLVDQVVDDDGETAVIQRQTYRKVQDAEGNFTGVVTSELAIFELAGWDDRAFDVKPADIKQIRVVEPLHELPPQITQIPVYHWKNFRSPADPFGSSQMRGIERLAAAINQTISDQDLAVALAGLGVYATDSAAPVNDDGEEVNWIIGPGRVIELSTGSTWKRVNGITSVQPSLDHASYLEAKIMQGSGVPEIAMGNVEVQAAESGIALSIRLSPLLAANKEKELDILGVTDQMLFDLQTMWFPAYEKQNFGDGSVLRIKSVVQDPMPQNRQARIDEIVALATATPPLISVEEAREELTKLGYKFGAGSAGKLVEQTAALAKASDPFSGRSTSELDNETDNTQP